MIILDKVAIWRPCVVDELSVRAEPIGRSHQVGSVIVKSDKPIFRYSKNYKIGKGESTIKFCLFIRTHSDAEKSIETFLNKVAKKVDKELAQKMNDDPVFTNFEYLDEFYKKGEK